MDTAVHRRHSIRILDRVSAEYSSKFAFTGGEIVKVVYDIADDPYVDIERDLAAALARD